MSADPIGLWVSTTSDPVQLLVALGLIVALFAYMVPRRRK
jgi:hypothetical protein